MPYPPDEILAEVGRVSIAGARLDYQLFQVWRHFDLDLRDAGGKKATNHRARVLAARRRPNQYRDVIKARAQEYLVDEWAAYVMHEVDDQDRVRAERDSLIHQDWVFRGDPAHAASPLVPSTSGRDRIVAASAARSSGP